MGVRLGGGGDPGFVKRGAYNDIHVKTIRQLHVIIIMQYKCWLCQLAVCPYFMHYCVVVVFFTAHTVQFKVRSHFYF